MIDRSRRPQLDPTEGSGAPGPGFFTVGQVVCVLLTLVSVAASQTTIQSDPVASVGGSAHKHVVRLSNGDLYAAAIFENATGDRELRLYRSNDAGASWLLEPQLVNDATSGLTAPNPVNACAMTVDSADRLHVTWGRYYYPSNFSQYYRQFDPTTGQLSALVDVSAITGAAATARTAAMSIIVDQDDTVWLVAQGPSSWVERLLQSNLPGATDLEFTDVGAISPSASAQNSRLAVDSLGRIHCSFYRNTGSGNYEHRIFDPANGWGASTVLGNTTPTNDYYGQLAADALGNVHALYVADSTAGATWLFQYRRWDETNGWSPSVTLFDALPADYTGIANYRVFALASDANTGTCFVAYRDLAADGELTLATKALGDPDFAPLVQLEPPSVAEHAYYLPTIRGSLFPTSNRVLGPLDITWQYRETSGTPPYELRFQRVTAGGDVFLRGDANADGVFDVSDTVYSLASLFILGSPPPPCLEAADTNDDAVFDISDSVFALAALFIPGSDPPPPPGSDTCGPDPSTFLGCDQYDVCP